MKGTIFISNVKTGRKFKVNPNQDIVISREGIGLYIFIQKVSKRGVKSSQVNKDYKRGYGKKESKDRMKIVLLRKVGIPTKTCSIRGGSGILNKSLQEQQR